MGLWDFQIHFWNSRNSQSENKASGKTEMDTIMNATFKPKTAYLLVHYGEIPHHINYINGLKLYLSLDISGYTILCGETLQFAHKVSNFYFNFASELTLFLRQNIKYFKLNTA